MKLFTGLLLIASLILMVYGYWGAFTEQGSKVYDEMDGFIPFILLITGGVLFLVSCVLYFLLRRNVKKQNSS